MYYLQRIITIDTKQKTSKILFTSASAENTAQSETILVYNLINLGWLIFERPV